MDTVRLRGCVAHRVRSSRCCWSLPPRKLSTLPPLRHVYMREPQLSPLARAGATADSSQPGPTGDPDYQEVAKRLNKLLSAQTMTGRELHTIIFKKWGRSYEARLHRRDGRMYLQVMWKFLEQKSFHMTPEQYMLQLDAVAELLTDWGAADMVRQAIAADKSRGPGYTGGSSARCVSIPLNVERSGLRSGEWSS